jgi:hypothetical protein
VTIIEFEADLQEMVSYRKNVTGVDHTLFISPKGNAQHAPRIKVAIDPPYSLDPRSKTAAIGFDGSVLAGEIGPGLLQQVRHFIKQNRRVLLAYWDYQIDTDELRQRLVKKS